LSALTASLAVPPGEADAQQSPPNLELIELRDDIDRLKLQCDYIWDNRADARALTEELNRLINGLPDAQTCDGILKPVERQHCVDQCTGLILDLLGGDPRAQIGNPVAPGTPPGVPPVGPVAEIPEDVDPY
jgi:hypothetical protein